ncbi:MAG: PorV/PorQ family protein [bacterium]
MNVTRSHWSGLRCAVATALVAATVVHTTPARAQSNSGALDLLLPIGARATAMGSAVVAEQGSEGAWWNPAGLARMTKPDFSLDHFATFQITSGDAVSLILPAGRVGVFAIGGRLFDYGSTPSLSTGNEQTGVQLIRSIVGSGSFAAAFGPRFSGGLAFRLYQLSAPCSGICGTGSGSSTEAVSGDFWSSGLDVGIQFRPSETSPLQLGAVISNIGPSLQVHDQQQADALPQRIRLGASYRPTSSDWDPAVRLRTTMEFVSTPGFSERELHFGGELGYVTGQATVALRGGYVWQQSSGPESGVGPSVGFGLSSGRVQLDFGQVFDSFSTGLEKPPRYISIRIGL